MNTKRSFIGLTTALFLVALGSGADEFYVVQRNPNPEPHDFKSWASAATSIQSAVDAASDGDIINVEDGTYTGTGQAVIHIYDKSLTLIGNTQDPGKVIVDGEGARRGLFARSSSLFLTMRGFTFSNGLSAADMGGAAYVDHTTTAEGLALFEDCAFVDSSALLEGGGLRSYGKTDSLFVTELRRCLVQGNRVTDTAKGYGGGISVRHTALIMEKVDVIENSSILHCGGLRIFNGVDARITDCKFIDNTSAFNGGGLYLYEPSTAAIYNSAFISNSVTAGNGGAISARGNPYITNCTFFANSADVAGKKGGSISVGSQCTEMHAVNSLFFRNTSNRGSSDSGVETIDVTPADNGFYLIENCTFAQNTGGVRFRGGTSQAEMTIRNSIVYENRTDLFDLRNYAKTGDGGALSIYNTCMNTLPDQEYDTAGNIAADPLFVDMEQDNYRLRARSPCINTGLYSSWMSRETDLDKKARIDRVFGLVDMGCFEHQPLGSVLLLR